MQQKVELSRSQNYTAMLEKIDDVNISCKEKRMREESIKQVYKATHRTKISKKNYTGLHKRSG